MVSSLFFVLLPLYIYPQGTAWQPLHNAITNNAHLNFKVIVNPNNGPGTEAYPDINYITNIAQLNTYSNVDLLGYVHTDWGNRAQSAIEADISTYAAWASYSTADIHVDGIFFDEAPTKASLVPWTATLTAFANTTFSPHQRSTPITILNPGTTPDPGYYSIASYVNAYEAASVTNTTTDLDAVLNAISEPHRPASTVMVYNCPVNGKRHEGDAKRFLQAGMAGLFMTTRGGYEQWCQLWNDFVGTVGAAAGLGAGR